MLKFMRDHLSRTFLVLIVGFIAIVFVFWGVFPDSGMGGGLGNAEVASVGGEKITLQEFQNAVNRDMDSYRAMGMDLPKEMMMNIKAGALQGLIQQKLMLVEARRLGIAASDKEVMDEIQRMPFFQDKDKKTFTTDMYKKVLAANNLSPGQFEQQVRESLTNQRMVKFLEARIRVTPAEVEREYKVSKETRDLQFVRITRDQALKRIKVDAKEVEKFLADASKEGAIKSFYAQNSTRYDKPETICARHILKRRSPLAKKEEVEKETTAPKDFLSWKPTTANFGALAQKHSEDTGTKANGGDLGCFPRGMMDKPFEDAAFQLPLNKVSAPVKSAFGWHYILVYKKNPAVKIPLEKARREIAEEILKRDRADEIRKINLAAAEEIVNNWPPKGEVVESTGPFNGLEGFIPKIGRADEILKAAFDPKAKIQSAPQIFEAQGGVIVAKVKAKSSADMSKFRSEQSVHSTTLRERKLRAFLPAWMDDVKERTKISYNQSLVERL